MKALDRILLAIVVASVAVIALHTAAQAGGQWALDLLWWTRR